MTYNRIGHHIVIIIITVLVQFSFQEKCVNVLEAYPDSYQGISNRLVNVSGCKISGTIKSLSDIFKYRLCEERTNLLVFRECDDNTYEDNGCTIVYNPNILVPYNTCYTEDASDRSEYIRLSNCTITDNDDNSPPIDENGAGTDCYTLENGDKFYMKLPITEASDLLRGNIITNCDKARNDKGRKSSKQRMLTSNDTHEACVELHRDQYVPYCFLPWINSTKYGVRMPVRICRKLNTINACSCSDPNDQMIESVSTVSITPSISEYSFIFDGMAYVVNKTGIASSVVPNGNSLVSRKGSYLVWPMSVQGKTVAYESARNSPGAKQGSSTDTHLTPGNKISSKYTFITVSYITFICLIGIIVINLVICLAYELLDHFKNSDLWRARFGK